MPKLSYPADVDERIFRAGTVQIGDRWVHLSACTVQGNSQPGQPYPNEDAFEIDARDRLVAGVFDGATSLKPISWLHHESGAHFASHFLKSILSETAAVNPPYELLTQLNQQLLKRSTTLGATSDPLDVHALPSSTATIVILEPDLRELQLCHISDSFAVAYMKDGSSRLLTPVHETYDPEMKALVARIARESGITPRLARNDPRVVELLLTRRQERHNAPDGSGDGVMNGDPAAALYFSYLRVPLEGIASILIASDGLFPLGASEQTDEGRATVLKLLNAGGFPALIDAKHASEDADPDWHFIRYKHSDDGTGIWIKF